MHVFDANVRLGLYNRWSGAEPITVDALLATMDHYGIHEALILDNLAYEYHVSDGNARILETVGGAPRLHAAWAALPPAGRELPPLAEMTALMEQLGIRALFLFPNQYHFTLDDWSVDDLLAPFAERRVPVFICPNVSLGGARPGQAAWRTQDLTDWPGVVRVCRAFPELPVVVVEERISYSLRTMYQALEACPNLHVELSTLWLHHVVEYVARHWGAERILFGSGLPRRDPGAVLGQLLFSDISPQEKAAIAGGNLRRLLDWNPAKPLPSVDVEFPAPIDKLHAIPRAGESLAGQGFHCAHGHVGPTPFLHIPDGAPAELVAELDRLGVERSILFTNGGLNSDEVYGNDLVADVVRRYPDRFLGFVSANMNRSPDQIRAEIERGFQMGLQGIKIHPDFSGYATEGPHVDLACAIANDRRTFILNHNWGSTERMVSLCRTYPDAVFMTGHTHPDAIPAVQQVDNLYIGTCPLNGYGVLERFVAEAGADRLLFGSDLSWNPVGWGIGPVLYARIPVEEKRLILGGNIRRLLAERGLG